MFDSIGPVRGAFAAALLIAGCSGAPSVPSAVRAPAPAPGRFVIREAPAGFTQVGDSVPPDDGIEALIAPYRSQLKDQLDEVLGHATGDFFKDDPEGALDNLVADALLHVVQRLAGDTVHVSLLNEGGLRVPVSEGPVLMRHAYELLPFENFVTVLALSGAQLERLADQIARTNGEPIAGWTMELEGDDAVRVLVGGEPVDPDRVYRLATVDYLVNGGGTWSVLWEARAGARQDLGVLIRDVFVEYVRGRGTVSPALDGRIRRTGGAGEGDQR